MIFLGAGIVGLILSFILLLAVLGILLLVIDKIPGFDSDIKSWIKIACYVLILVWVILAISGLLGHPFYVR